MYLKIDQVLYDPAKIDETKQILLDKVENSEELNFLFHQKKKCHTIAKVVTLLSNVYLIFWSLILILSIFDIFVLKNKASLALLLIGFALLLLSKKCQKSSRSLTLAYIDALHDKATALRFHDCFYNNTVLACYIATIYDNSCDVRVIAETSEDEIIEQDFHFGLYSSVDSNDIILDIEQNCVFYPLSLMLTYEDD